MSFVLLAVCLSADPVIAPWDYEARVSALEKKVAVLEAKCAACPCGVNAAAPSLQCANGVCQMVPTSGGFQSPCPNGQCGQSFGGPSFGSCASGQCGMSSGGGCAGGNCGSSGGRGFHPFRRR